MLEDLDPIHLRLDLDYLWVTLRDRRVIGIPLDTLLWLKHATPAQQSDYQLLPQTILWDSLDEALDTEEMLKGYPTPNPLMTTTS